MTSARKYFRHVISGGWATDLGPVAPLQKVDESTVAIPFLENAENMVFELSGAVRKVPGSAKINAAALESGADVHGIYDCWFSGTAGSPTQHRIVNVGTKIKADSADGNFSDLFTVTDGAIPSYAMLEDLLVIGLHTSDTPKSWDGTTAQALAGSPPNCGIFVTHANRLWGADDWSFPSRLWYSPLLDPENSTSKGWGKIDIDPDDGDIITGLASYRGELIVFKGPNRGSIHRVQGTSPTGADGFRRTPALVRGITAAWQNLIFQFGNDLGFMTPTGEITTLQAVQQFGDFEAATLSRGLRKFSRRINFARLNQGWAATNTDEDLVAFMLPVDGATTCNFCLVMDYRFEPIRFMQWPIHAGASIIAGIDAASNNRRVFYAGGGDGFLRKLGQANRTVDDNNEIDMLVTTPFVDYGGPFNVKTLGEGFVEFVPHNSGDISFFVRRDSQNRQQFDISQAAGDPLGTVSGTNFTLGASALAESSAVKRFFEFEGVGDWRQIQYEITNDMVGEDVEVLSFGAGIEVGPVSVENEL